ncbi:type II toxin-antitoxin system RelE/ParE family toxin [Methylotenera sp.]|uniref:type II toxin-antitoxin system RelE/ParE family toxin n=1 Tax=Methylotenera sp. TaxID=2051956 RepID=UPI002488F8FD|nr:type II toxin-antitoxin system RelE/ParE family toxin [Methylotenera sp.]MDI1298006.1 type II toxin-antitoxin system RelE/ParE family toxin [Methylotenera sp.]
MIYQIRFTRNSKDDLKRLYLFLYKQDKNSAKHARDNIYKAIDTLKIFPFTCRKAQANSPFLRELVISFGANGYVAMFEIEEDNTVTILAVRHQREDDFR